MEINAQLQAPRRFTPGNVPRYPFYTRLDAPRSRAQRFGEKKNLLPLSGFEPREVKSVVVVTPTTVVVRTFYKF